VLCAYLIFYKFTRHRRKPLGRRLREAFEELGTAFIKIGQLLSLRYDLLSQEDCDELHHLLDSVAPFPYELAREIFKHDFGIYPEKAFRSFSAQPVSSGSIAQVHEAMHKGGTRVAVKIRRPWIGKQIEQDVRIFSVLARVAQFFSPRLRRLKFTDVLAEINSSLLREIDLRNESSNIKAFTRQLEERRYERDGIGRIAVPKVYDKLCSYNVLTMEFLEGIPLIDWKEPDKRRGYDALASVNTVLSNHVAWLFGDRSLMIHGDPHPANLIIMRNGDVGLVDFGIVSVVPEGMVKKLNNTFFAVYMKDADTAARGTLSFAGKASDEVLLKKIAPDVGRFVSHAHEGNIAYWIYTIIEILGKHGLPFPRELAIMGRGFVVIDGVIHALDESKGMIDLVSAEFEYGIRNRALRNIRETDYFPLLFVLSEKLKGNPQMLSALVGRYADDPFLILEDIRRSLT
jgi:ubiquinone biosynthesis protein